MVVFFSLIFMSLSPSLRSLFSQSLVAVDILIVEQRNFNRLTWFCRRSLLILFTSNIDLFTSDINTKFTIFSLRVGFASIPRFFYLARFRVRLLVLRCSMMNVDLIKVFWGEGSGSVFILNIIIYILVLMIQHSSIRAENRQKKWKEWVINHFGGNISFSCLRLNEKWFLGLPRKNNNLNKSMFQHQNRFDK